MADAKVIPFDEDSRSRRGGGRSRARSRKAAAAGGKTAGRTAGQAAGQTAADQAPLTAVPEIAEIPGQTASGGQGEVAAPEGQRATDRAAGRAPAAGDADPGSGQARTSGAEPSGADASRTDSPGADASSADSSSADSSSAGTSGAGTSGAGTSGGPGTAEGAGAGRPPEPDAPSPAGILSGIADRLLGDDWERRAAAKLAFLRRRVTGEYKVDEFGYDEELTEQVLMPLFRPLFEKYFRVEVKGVENIPSEGGALVVCNHSGTLPWDGVMAQIAVHDHHPAGRHLRLLAADLVFALPGVNELARKGGHTLACSEDAQLLLERGEVVGVMPEGFKGLGKPFAERYKLQRFGRGGFVATALKTRKPIVPCSIVGAEEIYPMLGDSRTMARLLGIPYFPLTPTFPWLGPLGTIPLPTKWTIQFGEPIPTDGYPPESADDPMVVFNLTDQVRETIQHTLYELLVQRRSVFF